MNREVYIASGAALIFLLGVPAAVFFLNREGLKMMPALSTIATVATTSMQAPPSQTQVTAPAGYTKYYSRTYRFSLYHLVADSIKQYDEGSGAATFIFQSIKQARGFQIFVVPYPGATISDDRFKKDIPSGVREQIENTYVDGVQAVTFIGQDGALGRTREVWFIHNGYLYEVTAPESQTDFIVTVMRTWEFL